MNKSVKKFRLAVAAGMTVIRPYIYGTQVRKKKARLKRDKTFVTEVDNLSRKAARQVLLFFKKRGYELTAEDGKGIKCQKSTRRLLLDGLDGTYGFMIFLPTCTVILAIYDKAKQEIVGCFVGEPSTGQIWWAYGGSPCFRERYDYNSEKFVEKTKVHVWKGALSRKSAIFLDISHEFKRRGKGTQVTTGPQMARLFANLNRKSKILIPGSNGLIHALTANGGEGVAGGITTAMGGEWDACGLYLVLRAGGFLRAFRKNKNGTLTECNPLNPYEYDMLVFGNGKNTVNALIQALLASFKATS